MNLRTLEFPRHVHRFEAGQIVASKLVATVEACEAALADGFCVITPGGLVETGVAPALVVDPPASVEMPKRKPGRPPKQQEG